MKSLFSKITALFALFAALHFAEACTKEGIDCSCPSVLPFFDYNTLKVNAETPIAVEKLDLKIEADSLEFLAFLPPAKTDFGIITSAWACSCLWDGHDGPKHAIQSLNIYADRDFNDTLPAGTSLNSLFYEYASGDDVVYFMSPNHQPNGFWRFAGEVRPIEVHTFEKPNELGVPFRFRVEIMKENGDTLSAETGEIFFQ